MLDLTLTNRVLDAAEAESWGLVNRVVADDEVDTAVAALAQQLADGPAWVTGQAKRVVYHGYENTLADGRRVRGRRDRAGDESARRSGGDRAFAEKRTPDFTGG